jgi:hypothetical protein
MKRVFVIVDVIVGMNEVEESRLKHGESVKAVGSVWREARGGRTMIEVWPDVGLEAEVEIDVEAERA